MIGEIIKYFLLGVLLGEADRASSNWIRTGKERRERIKLLGALRYLVENYQPKNAKQALQDPEFRNAATMARHYFRNQEGAAADEKLEQLFARLEERAARAVELPHENHDAPTGAESRASGASRWVRFKHWFAREKLLPLALKTKAIFAAAIALLIDLSTFAGSGFSSGFDEFLYSLIEAPALLGGILSAPAVGRAGQWLLHAAKRSPDAKERLEELSKKIEGDPDLRLLLSGPLPPLLHGSSEPR